jgi:hypothetical protein
MSSEYRPIEQSKTCFPFPIKGPVEQAADAVFQSVISTREKHTLSMPSSKRAHSFERVGVQDCSSNFTNLDTRDPIRGHVAAAMCSGL